MNQQSGTFGQGLATAGRLVECFPRDLPHEEARNIIENPDFLKEFLSGIGSAFRAYSAPVPADNVKFELALDGNEIDPIEMPKNDGYVITRNWKFIGNRIFAVGTRPFKLVGVGYCRDFDEVLSKLRKHGKIPGGQWREAFRKRFRRPTSQVDFIGIADASWVDTRNCRRFPYLDGSEGMWDSFFATTARDFHDDWRWLVTPAV